MLPCPCCRYDTLIEHAAFEMCPICWWEVDGQDRDAEVARGGPNGTLSLAEARRNFEVFGASDQRFAEKVRQPLPSEKRAFSES